MFLKKRIFEILFLIMGLFLWKNLSSKNNFKSHDMEVEKPYVKALYSMPITYDPIKLNDTASIAVTELIYEGLLRFDNNYGFQPAIAISWSTSQDGRLIKFILRPNAKFHNGTEVTAQDVVYSLTRNLSKKSLVHKHYENILGGKKYYFGKEKFVQGLRAVSDKEVHIELESPDPSFLYILAGASSKILPHKLLSESGNFFEKPIGSGPFILDQFSKDEIRFKRFENYYDEKALLKEIIFKISDQNIAIELAKKNEVHDLSCWPFDGEEPIFNYGQKYSSPTSETWIIGLNTKIKPFDNLEIRKLFKIHIDSEKFRKTFYPNAIPALGYMPPIYTSIQYESAKNYTKSITPPKEQIILFIPEGLTYSQEIKSYFENELKEKGWNINGIIIPWNKMIEKYNHKSMASFLMSMNMDFPDPLFLFNNFASDNPDNFSGIRNSQIDQLIKSIVQESDQSIRNKTISKLANLVEEQALTVNLFHPRGNYWVHSCIRGFLPNQLEFYYLDYRKVYWDKECLNKLQSNKS